ncbi:hypothetical protein [Sphingomonas sp.]|uniref:hypothetical protein n=1 Tax=Sphingomonas sp. TaxID=28214 RepID=UPI001B0F23B7|nr:hypothetical protein [Sphingomonas sp.]MBO9712945.1 hypothetical protein [Sphingomonas sp.]
MLHSNQGLGSQYTTMGPVRVRLTGVARTDGEGKPLPSVTAPTVAEASSALERMARVVGADAVLKPSTDYRAAALAAGPLGSLTHIVVTASGTAVAYNAVESEKSDASDGEAEDEQPPAA